MKEMGGFRGDGLAMADAALVRESLVDAALMNGAVVSGKMAAGDGGMTAAQHAELRRVQRRSVRAITGTNKATSTAAVDAEMGIISLELATAIKVMQWWGESHLIRLASHNEGNQRIAFAEATAPLTS